jgi:hypothetical protein
MRWTPFALLGLVMALDPSSVAARCAGGTFATCASVAVSIRQQPGSGVTLVDFLIRNLGQIGDDAVWFVNVSNLPGGPQLRGGDPAGPNGSTFLNYTASGPVGRRPGCDPVEVWSGPNPCDTLDGAWDDWCDPGQHAVCWPDEYEMFPLIHGCTATDPFQTGGRGIQTCGALGFTGGALFSFAFDGLWRTEDLAIYLNNGDVCQVGSSGLGGHLAACSPMTVAPEPATSLLMMTGLAAIGAGAWRRRRPR